MNSQPDETPLEVPEADAFEQRQPAGGESGDEEQQQPLPEDVPEADALEQRTPLRPNGSPAAPDLSAEEAAEADAIEQSAGTPGSDEDDYPFAGEVEPEQG
ncbi:hypothetical protein [Arthrobacter globiformis]|uniref:hypothetical protein n=1 Tax=Arthrobacter globiformis TaxID=1665 RepID=UPI0027873E59|nr:hypothetical protein [Arthrobacter globiformis]MDQ0863663.1 hypothetical protein [Arthrobacter globiformis]